MFYSRMVLLQVTLCVCASLQGEGAVLCGAEQAQTPIQALLQIAGHAQPRWATILWRLLSFFLLVGVDGLVVSFAWWWCQPSHQGGLGSVPF